MHFLSCFRKNHSLRNKKTVFLFVHVTDYKATCILIKIVIFYLRSIDMCVILFL